MHCKSGLLLAVNASNKTGQLGSSQKDDLVRECEEKLSGRFNKEKVISSHSVLWGLKS